MSRLLTFWDYKLLCCQGYLKMEPGVYVTNPRLTDKQRAWPCPFRIWETHSPAVWCEAQPRSQMRKGWLVWDSHSLYPPGSCITLKVFSWFYSWWKSILPWNQKGFTKVAITKYRRYIIIQKLHILLAHQRGKGLPWELSHIFK